MIQFTQQEERNWTVVCHLAGIIPVYFLDLIVPAALWYTQKSKSAFLDEQGLEITNFHLSMAIYKAALFCLAMTGIGAPLSIVGFIILAVIDIVSVIRGAIKASKGEGFLYPVNLRLLS